MPKSKVSAPKTIQLDVDKEKKKKSKAKSTSSGGGSVSVSGSKKKGGSTQQKPRQSLDPIREQLRVLVDEANARVKELQDVGATSIALEEAVRSRLKSWGEDEPMFRADLPRMRDIKRELARTQAFLTDYTSTPEGAVAFVGGLTHERGLFGGQWRQKGMAGYNEDVVSKEDADLVFDVYHRAIEQAGGWERVIGYFRANNSGFIDYGSEELVNMVYDMVLNQPNMSEEDLIAQTYNYIEDMIDLYERIAEKQQAGVDYGEIVSDPDRDVRIARWKWQVERERRRNESK